MIPGEPIDLQPYFYEYGIDRSDSVILAQHLEPGPIESEVPAALVAQDDAVQDTMEEFVASEEQGGWEDSALEGLDDFDRSSLSLLPAVVSPLVDHMEVKTPLERTSWTRNVARSWVKCRKILTITAPETPHFLG